MMWLSARWHPRKAVSCLLPSVVASQARVLLLLRGLGDHEEGKVVPDLLGKTLRTFGPPGVEAEVAGEAAAVGDGAAHTLLDAAGVQTAARHATTVELSAALARAACGDAAVVEHVVADEQVGGETTLLRGDVGGRAIAAAGGLLRPEVRCEVPCAAGVRTENGDSGAFEPADALAVGERLVQVGSLCEGLHDD